MAHMELVIANVGLGVASGVRWWFDGVDKEDWKSRGVYGIGWPDCGRHSAGIEILKPGDEEVSHTGRGAWWPDRLSRLRLFCMMSRKRNGVCMIDAILSIPIGVSLHVT